jgi:hypothetical protein
MSTNRSDYIARDEKSVADPLQPLPSHDDIAALAHALWVARGGGDGGAETDWFEALRLLSEQRSKGHAA